MCEHVLNCMSVNVSAHEVMVFQQYRRNYVIAVCTLHTHLNIKSFFFSHSQVWRLQNTHTHLHNCMLIHERERARIH